MVKKKSMRRRNKGVSKPEEPEELVKAPHSFIISQGKVGNGVVKLKRDLRHVMEPFTATHLQDLTRNSLKEIVGLAGPLHVTHLIILSQTENGVNLKFCRLPWGPTLTFRVMSYTLRVDVMASQKKGMDHPSFYRYAACPMTNLQPQDGPLQDQLCARMFLDAFPTIKPHKTKSKNIHRCVLLNHDEESDTLDFRHYTIRIVPVGVSKAVKKLLKKNVPSMGKFQDVTDFVTKSEVLSESEAEEDPSSHIKIGKEDLPSPAKIESDLEVKHSEKKQAYTSAVRLYELGPRMTLELIKVEEGLTSGCVLYHRFIHLTDEEKLLAEKRREQEKNEKQKRKRQQEINVLKKQQMAEEHKQRCLQGMRSYLKGDKDENNEGKAPGDDDEDNLQYYREEVGQEPGEEFLAGQQKHKRTIKTRTGFQVKRLKVTGNESTPGKRLNWRKLQQIMKNRRKELKPDGRPKQKSKML